MNNSCIFKNLIWNKMLTATFPASSRKYFRCLKVYLKLIGWELLLFSYLLKNQRLKFTFSTEELLQFLLWWSWKQRKIWLKEIGNSTYNLKTMVCLKIKKSELLSWKKIFIQKSVCCVKSECFLFSYLLLVSYYVYCSWYVISKLWPSFTLQVCI